MERAAADAHRRLTLAPICLVLALSDQHHLAAAGPCGGVAAGELARRHLVWYLLLFSVSLWLQLGLPAELALHAVLPGAADHCAGLALRLAGALIATLMNAIALIASQTWHDHPVDLLLSLLAQSLTGLLLGAGIQRLRELNQSLQNELARNHRLRNACWTEERAPTCANCMMISARPSPPFVPRRVSSSAWRRKTHEAQRGAYRTAFSRRVRFGVACWAACARASWTISRWSRPSAR
jgi:hypothetical protein